MTEQSAKFVVKPGKLLSGKTLQQIHMNADKVLPKVGLKNFAPSNSWLEKRQIETLLEEYKSLLEVERVEKWGSLSGASWKPSIKLAEVTRRIGRHFNTMGFERNGNLYLYPEEALHLLETNSLELLFGGVPMSLQQAYALLLGSESGCSANEYRTYSHLVRQGYRVLRPTKQVQTTQYERQIRLDQHTSQKRLHPSDTSAMSSENAEVGDKSSDINLKVTNPSVVSAKRQESDHQDQGKSTKVIKQVVLSDESNQGNGANSSLNEEDDDGSLEELCNQNSGGNSLRLMKDPEDAAESKAYGIAKSLVSLGTDLMKQDTTTFGSKGNSTSDMSVILCKQIMQVLGSHFDNDVSKEALEDLALSAAQTILSHRVSKPCSDEAQKGTSGQTDTQVGGESSACVLQEDEESKDNMDTSFPHKNHQPDDTVLKAVEGSSRVEVETPMVNDIPKSGNFSGVGHSLSMPLKRQQSEEIDENESTISKKAKLVDVSDSEIEILDVVTEKKVELIDLSEDDSDLYSVPVPIQRRSGTSTVSKREVIDVDIVSQSDSDNSSSDSSNSSTQNSSDSSVVCIESQKHKNVYQDSGYHKMFDRRRRNILNTFPCMYSRNEITLSAPDPELLPEHVRPNSSTYVINRWKLNRESKQMYQQLQHNCISSERVLLHDNSIINPWTAQNIPPLSNFLLGSVPSDPWVLMQTLAHLLLPFTNQVPQPHPGWSRSTPIWTPQAMSWPRPSWPRQPYFKPHQNWNQRPHVFRYNNPRYSRPNRSRPFYTRSRPSSRRQSEHFQNQNSSNIEAISSSNNRRVQQDCFGNDNNLHRRKSEHMASSCRFENSASSISRGGHQRVRGKKKTKNRGGLSWRGTRYFNPPSKYQYHHIRLMNEKIPVKRKRKIKTSKTVDPVKHESSSSDEGSSSSQDEEEHGTDEGHEEDHEGDDGIDQSMEGSDNSKSSLLQPHQCSNFASVCRSLQVIPRADSAFLGSLRSHDLLKLCFDIFLPNSSFKKGSLPTPNFHLCIMDVNDPVPSPCGVSFLSRKLDDGVPILFAIVHPDSITFLQFLDVSLPLLPVDL